MPRKRYSAEEIIGKLREAEVALALTDLLASPDRLLSEAKRLRLYTTEALPEHLLREESRGEHAPRAASSNGAHATRLHADRTRRASGALGHPQLG